MQSVTGNGVEHEREDEEAYMRSVSNVSHRSMTDQYLLLQSRMKDQEDVDPIVEQVWVFRTRGSDGTFEVRW